MTQTAIKSKAPKLPRVSLKLVRERSQAGYEAPTFHSPTDAEQYLEFMRELPEEQFIAVLLDSQHKVIGLQVVSHGTLSCSLVHPREVFKAAILSNAHSILVAHNHPSGNPTPSPEDLETTATLIKASKIMGIQLLDHLVIGDKTVSIREHHERLWRDY